MVDIQIVYLYNRVYIYVYIPFFNGGLSYNNICVYIYYINPVDTVVDKFMGVYI
jgi:hypothetical protein